MELVRGKTLFWHMVPQELRFHYGREAWQQEAGKATRTGSWELTSPTISIKQREQNGSKARVYNLKAHTPPQWHASSRKATPPKTPPNSTSNWEASVQTPALMGDISHSNYCTVHIEQYTKYHNGSLRKWIRSLSKNRLVVLMLANQHHLKELFKN